MRDYCVIHLKGTPREVAWATALRERAVAKWEGLDSPAVRDMARIAAANDGASDWIDAPAASLPFGNGTLLWRGGDNHSRHDTEIKA